jgi:hypothetical protein
MKWEELTELAEMHKNRKWIYPGEAILVSCCICAMTTTDDG